MYNLSFEMMAKMFNGERTARQLKKKYEKELQDHPEMVHRALRVQINEGGRYLSILTGKRIGHDRCSGARRRSSTLAERSCESENPSQIDRCL